MLKWILCTIVQPNSACACRAILRSHGFPLPIILVAQCVAILTLRGQQGHLIIPAPFDDLFEADFEPLPLRHEPTAAIHQTRRGTRTPHLPVVEVGHAIGEMNGEGRARGPAAAEGSRGNSATFNLIVSFAGRPAPAGLKTES